MTDLAGAYRQSRTRLAELVGVTADAAGTPVPACPGWSVHDVLCHLAAVAEDVLSDRLRRPPTDEEAAIGVSRRQGLPTPEVLSQWRDLSAGIEGILARRAVWPLVMDVLSHEQDVRGAVGQPGCQDIEIISDAARVLVKSISVPVELMVTMSGIDLGPTTSDSPDLHLDTTAFEIFRFRLGRRSRRQMAGMGWTGDPSAVLDRLAIFPPTAADLDI